MVLPFSTMLHCARCANASSSQAALRGVVCGDAGHVAICSGRREEKEEEGAEEGRHKWSANPRHSNTHAPCSCPSRGVVHELCLGLDVLVVRSPMRPRNCHAISSWDGLHASNNCAGDVFGCLAMCPPCTTHLYECKARPPHLFPFNLFTQMRVCSARRRADSIQSSCAESAWHCAPQIGVQLVRLLSYDSQRLEAACPCNMRIATHV